MPKQGHKSDWQLHKKMEFSSLQYVKAGSYQERIFSAIFFGEEKLKNEGGQNCHNVFTRLTLIAVTVSFSWSPSWWLFPPEGPLRTALYDDMY